jgi:hypothetical protein
MLSIVSKFYAGSSGHVPKKHAFTPEITPDITPDYPRRPTAVRKKLLLWMSVKLILVKREFRPEGV